MVDGKIQYVRLGQGEVPIFEAIDALSKVDTKAITVLSGRNFWHQKLKHRVGDCRL